VVAERLIEELGEDRGRGVMSRHTLKQCDDMKVLQIKGDGSG